MAARWLIDYRCAQIFFVDHISFGVEGQALVKVDNVGVAIVYHVDIVVFGVTAGVGRSHYVVQPH